MHCSEDHDDDAGEFSEDERPTSPALTVQMDQSPPVVAVPTNPSQQQSVTTDNPGKEVKKIRFRWKNEMVQNLIIFLNKQKTAYAFKGLDFEADLVRLYREIRVMMAKRYETGEFGPIKERNLPKGLISSELAKEKVKIQQDRKTIRAGYDRIRNMAKKIRQNYRKAVTEGTRSGSGKVICENWEELKAIWGGSPATITLTNAVTSTRRKSADNEGISQDQMDNDGEESDESETEDIEEDDEGASENEQVIEGEETDGSTSKLPNPTPKFVDNKRKNMEKNLSASQRDQVYLNMAKNELKLKQTMVDQLTAATTDSNKAFEKISQSIESVGKSIGDGLLALAGAIGNSNRPQPSPVQQHYPYNPNYQPYHDNARQTSTPRSSSSSFEAPSNSMNMSYYENL